MTMPWDNPQPGGEPFPAPQFDNMTPDIPPPAPSAPVSALNPDTGKMVSVDVPDSIRDAIHQAITGAMAAQPATRPIIGITRKEKPKYSPTGEAFHLEENFSGGPATNRTLMHGLGIDLAFAAMATLATVTSDSFNFFDKEAWTVVGVLLVKTLVQTAMSYMMKMKVE